MYNEGNNIIGLYINILEDYFIKLYIFRIKISICLIISNYILNVLYI